MSLAGEFRQPADWIFTGRGHDPDIYGYDVLTADVGVAGGGYATGVSVAVGIFVGV